MPSFMLYDTSSFIYDITLFRENQFLFIQFEYSGENMTKCSANVIINICVYNSEIQLSAIKLVINVCVIVT